MYDACPIINIAIAANLAGPTPDDAGGCGLESGGCQSELLPKAKRHEISARSPGRERYFTGRTAMASERTKVSELWWIASCTARSAALV